MVNRIFMRDVIDRQFFWRVGLGVVLIHSSY